MLNLIQLQERLKKQPDNVVVAAANGQIKNIPPFMASSELLRRKQMRDEAAAAQSAEMEGADTTVTEDLAQEIATPSQAKEQIAGLLALQGNRQQQAARQQAGIQSAMAMAAPNTTTSEPAQLAAGGAIDDIVVPRDFQGGGIAMNPDVMKKLMMLKAMKARQQGVAGLPMKQDMFRRGDYAGGGIVAFAGPEGSFVERSPGFYQLESELPKEESAPTTPKEVFEEILRRRRERQSLEERMAQAGLLEPPGPTQELAALEAQQQRRREADTLARRVMSLDPLRIGRSMADYLGKEEAAETDIEAKKAKARDLHASAKFNAAKGNIKDAIADEREADKTDKEIAAAMSRSEYEGALGEQAGRGKTTTFTQLMQAIEEADRNPTPENLRKKMAALQAAAFASYRGPQIESQEGIANIQNMLRAEQLVNEATEKINKDYKIRILTETNPDKKRELEEERDSKIRARAAEIRGSGVGTKPSTAPTPPANAPQPAPADAKAPDISSVKNAPSGASIGNFINGKGWEVKDKTGKIIGYARS